MCELLSDRQASSFNPYLTLEEISSRDSKHWGSKYWGSKHWGSKHWGSKHWGSGHSQTITHARGEFQLNSDDYESGRPFEKRNQFLPLEEIKARCSYRIGKDAPVWQIERDGLELRTLFSGRGSPLGQWPGSPGGFESALTVCG